MTTWHISLDDWGRSYLRPHFQALNRAQQALGCSFCLVGALAKDLWIEGILQKHPSRLTKDIDIAFLAIDYAARQKVIDYLTKSEGFRLVPNSQVGLLGPNNYRLDLLPFGPIEENGFVQLPGKNGDLPVHGFEEACKSADLVFWDNQFAFQVLNPPGIVLLKLISFDDRPDRRGHDLSDIRELATHYFELVSESIYDVHHDLLLLYDENDLHGYPLKIGSHLIGRKMAGLLLRNLPLKHRVQGILRRLMDQKRNGPWSAILTGLME